MKNKLHENQLRLLRHLARFQLLSYSDCLELLDTEGTTDRAALSYAFRPLTKKIYLQTAGWRRVYSGKGPRPVSGNRTADLHRWWSRRTPPGHGGVPHGCPDGAQRRSCGW